MGSYGHGLGSADARDQVATPGWSAAVSPVVQSVLEDSSGRIWAGTFEYGVTMMEKSGLIRNFPAGETGGGNSLCLFEDSRGRIWTFGGQEVAVFENGAFLSAEEEMGLPRGVVKCFAEGAGREIYAAHAQGVFVLTEGRFKPLPDSHGLPVKGVSSIFFEIQRETIWMGTGDRGLLRLRRGVLTSMPASSGLPSDKIHGMIDDALGHLWMMTGKGVVRVAWQDLHTSADGSSSRVPYLLFDAADGLPGTEFSEGRQPLAARDLEGNLWFPLLRGAAVINPATFVPDSVPPPVHVEQVSFMRREPGGNPGREVRLLMPSGQMMEVPAGSGRLAVHYAALGYAAPALAADGESPGRLLSTIQVELEQIMAEASAGYRLWEGGRGYFDIYAGIRYMRLDGDLSLGIDAAGISAFSRDLSGEALNSIASAIREEMVAADRGAKSKLQTAVISEAQDRVQERVAMVLANHPNLPRAIEFLKDADGPLNDALRALIASRLQEERASLLATKENAAGQLPAVTSRIRQKARSAVDRAEKKLARRIEDALIKAIPARVSGSADWVDPIIGFRGRFNFSPRIYTVGRADIGGFGVSSDLSWQAYTGLGWQISPRVTAEIGYRALQVDYTRSDFTYDALTSGIFTALAIQF